MRPTFRSPGALAAAVGGGRFRLSISTALIAGICGLVFLGTVSVLGIGLWGAARNTLGLLSDKADMATGGLARSLRQHLDPVSEASAYLSELIRRGEIDVADAARLADYMRGAMAATPQVLGMDFISPAVDIVRVDRRIDRSDGAPGFQVLNRAGAAGFGAALAEARRRDRPFWGPLIWYEQGATTLVNLRSPIERDGRFVGLLVSVVSVRALSRFLRDEPAGPLPDGFILYGPNHVLAHRSLAEGAWPRSGDIPLPGIEQIGDPVLANLWNEAARRELGLLRSGQRTKGHRVAVGGEDYPVLYRALEGYADRTLLVGAYVRPGPARGGEILRLWITGLVGLGVLVLGVAAALLLGRGLARPIAGLAEATRRVGALDLSDVPAVPASRLRELDDAAQGFNGMIGALRRFETYVPRKLVARLIALGPGAEIASEEREVTVMFTDIVRFTTLAEALGPTETARLLNAHFSLLAACIDAAEGTLDKYIGDSAMAFWGPPFGGADHAGQACRAALAIRGALAADNARRRAAGLAPVQVRIGLHTGPAIVGNIGAPGRINYTLVGDTVNTAQRLEQLAKTAPAAADAGEDAAVLLSETVEARVRGRFPLRPLGSRAIRGRARDLEVYAL